jgi:hypothetical protein
LEGVKGVDVFYFVRLVGGAGDIKLTKDGKVLLNEMVRSPFHSIIYFF